MSLLVLFACLLACLFFMETGFLFCSSGCPGIPSIDQASLELRDPSASASKVLGLKACATTARLQLSSQVAAYSRDHDKDFGWKADTED